MRPHRLETCAANFKNLSEPGQEANNRLLPSLVRGDGAALGAMVRKIFKNDARAVILP